VKRPLVFEEESITLHHVAFDKKSKKLQIEKVNLKNKKVVEKWSSEIDMTKVKPSKVLELHQAIGIP
jgi:cell division protein FtsL